VLSDVARDPGIPAFGASDPEVFHWDTALRTASTARRIRVSVMWPE
jgi:hypothetical protein